MESADLLYMPMPFGEAHEKFARYSLSTKMVTYAGSGVPILYHGPATSAAFDLLKRNDAAILSPVWNRRKSRNAFRIDGAKASGRLPRTRSRWPSASSCWPIKRGNSGAHFRRRFLQHERTCRLIVITTRLPPQICGIGAYSWLAHKYRPEDSSARSVSSSWRGPPNRGHCSAGMQSPISMETRERWSRRSIAPVATNVLLHYAGRAYQRFGCPVWMPGVLRNWKAKFPDGRLTVFFHECPVNCRDCRGISCWEKSTRRIIRQLAAVADVLATNTENHAAILRKLSGREVPLPSRRLEYRTGRQFVAASGETEFVIFGLPFGRCKLCKCSNPEISKWQDERTSHKAAFDWSGGRKIRSAANAS